jgi:hypothetical protein
MPFKSINNGVSKEEIGIALKSVTDKGLFTVIALLNLLIMLKLLIKLKLKFLLKDRV